MNTVSLVGVLLCVGGEVLRKLAMFTAKTNFSHIVQSVHEEGHQLVTHGVYKYCRHPSYVGWFYWSIGTQVCRQLRENVLLLCIFVAWGVKKHVILRSCLDIFCFETLKTSSIMWSWSSDSCVDEHSSFVGYDSQCLDP